MLNKGDNTTCNNLDTLSTYLCYVDYVYHLREGNILKTKKATLFFCLFAFFFLSENNFVNALEEEVCFPSG